MEKDQIQFAKGVVAGIIVMILFAVVTVNILSLIPLFSPFIGGIVAGAVAGKDFLNGGKAGIVAGFLGAIAVALDVIGKIGFLTAAAPIPLAAGVLFFILALMYFPILGFIGGAAGGYLRK
jgi:hypothetical protein